MILFLFFLILVAVYSPVLYFNYLFHDDGSFWVKVKELGGKHIFFDACMFEGRYGDALLLHFENSFVHKISDLKFLRFLGVAITACSAWTVWRQMRRSSVGDLEAFLVVSAMFFLPAFAGIIFYSISSALFSLCIFLSCWSFQRIETGKGTALGFAGFLFALTIYPPAAMIYWTMAGMRLLFVPQKPGAGDQSHLWRCIVAGITAIFVYVVSVFLMDAFFRDKMAGSFYDPYKISWDLPAKFWWFVHEPLGNALNLWNIFPQPSVSIIVTCFIVFTALVVRAKKGTTKDFLRRLLLLAAVFVLAFLPNFAARGDAAFYRCLAPLSSLVWLTLVWAVFQWGRMFPQVLGRRRMPALLCVMAVLGGATTFYHVLYGRVLPSHLEWLAYQSMARQIRSKQAQAVDIVLPFHDPSRERYDEFGVLSSHYTGDIWPLMWCALHQTGGQGGTPPPVYVSYPGDSMLLELNPVFIQKLPTSRWMGRPINTDGGFHEVQGLSSDTMDRALVYDRSPQPVSLKVKNWFVLNLNDWFQGPARGDGEGYPELAQAYDDRGNIYFQHRNFAQAISDYTKAVVLKPDYEDAYYNLGLAFYKQGNPEAAFSSLEKAVALNPQDTTARHDLAAMYQLRKIVH